MQHFDNLTHYDESDFDDYILYSPSNKKSYLDSELKQFYFLYSDAWGDEQELFTAVECIWRVVPPDPKTWDSDWDFYGYTEVVSWKVLSVENSQGEEIKPEEVLTLKQLESYNTGLINFIEG